MAEGRENYLLGEVWEDATNKISYGSRRRFLRGRQLDSVMNYPLASAIVNYVKGGNSRDLVDTVLDILENYPPQAVKLLMNHIGTHDTARILTVLGKENEQAGDRAWQSAQKLTDEEYSRGVRLLKLAAVLQFTLPGVPSVYYGDEAGVEGCADPFCRRTYPWGREDQDMLARYKAMAAMRNGHPVLKTGECAYIAPCSAVLGVIRKNENGKDAFGKKAENACAVTLINRSAREVVVYLTSADVSGAQTLVSDDGQIFTARSGAFSVKIKGLQGMTMFAM